MATKCKPQGPRYNKFEIWTKVVKLAKSQGLKWQFTRTIYIETFRKSCSFFDKPNYSYHYLYGFLSIFVYVIYIYQLQPQVNNYIKHLNTK
ncbi:hypothetical protein Hanom_Chr02g00142951 [Helianthus anomalus]